MKKKDAHQPCKRHRLMSRDGSSGLSSGASAAVVQLPSVVVDGATPANPITLADSSDDSNGGATTSKVSNNEIVSF